MITSFREELRRKGSIVYTNVGVSMMPLIREHRDIMIIRPLGDRPIKKYDAVLYERPGVQGRGQYVLHRVLRRNSDGSYWIIGDNCLTGENVAPENILGRLSDLVRDGRKIDMEHNWKYWLYVHTWCACYPVRIFLTRVRGKLGRIYHKCVNGDGYG